MVQILVPVSTDAAGSWSPSTFANVDDDSTVSPTGDDVYCTSNSVNGGPTSTVQWGLADGTDPVSSSGHVLRVRWSTGHSSGSFSDATVRLRQGTTTIVDLVDALSGFTEIQSEHVLTSGQADAITDYTNLNVQVFADTGTLIRSIRVDLVELEVPDAAGGPVSGDATLNAAFSFVASGHSVSRGDATLSAAFGAVAAGHTVSHAGVTLAASFGLTAAGHTVSHASVTLGAEFGFEASGTFLAPDAPAASDATLAFEFSLVATGHDIHYASAALAMEFGLDAETLDRWPSLVFTQPRPSRFHTGVSS